MELIMLRTTVAMQRGGVKCSGCSNSMKSQKEHLFEDADSLWTHITVAHAGWIPFECVHCPLMFMPSELVLKQHYEQLHPGMTPQAIYTYEEEKKAHTKRIFLESWKIPENSRNNDSFDINFQASTSFTTADIPIGKTNEITSAIEEQHESTLADEEIKTENHSNDSLEDTTYSVTRRRTAKKRASNVQRIWCSLCKHSDTDAKTKTTHVWRFHMKTRRFRCNECPFETSVPKEIKAHSEYKHKRDSGIWWTDRTEELKPLYQRQFNIAFGKSGHRHSCLFRLRAISPLRKDISRSTSDCQLCGKPVYRIKRDSHIWRHHVTGKRYECSHCDMVSNSELKVVKRHASTQHNVNPKENVCWVDNTEAMMKEYKTAYEKAFSGKAPNKRKITIIRTLVEAPP